MKSPFLNKKILSIYKKESLCLHFEWSSYFGMDKKGKRDKQTGFICGHKDCGLIVSNETMEKIREKVAFWSRPVIFIKVLISSWKRLRYALKFGKEK